MPYAREEHVLGHAKQIAYGDTLATATNTIFGTREVSLPERELGTADITNDNSPDFHKDYLPALYEPGTVSFTYVYAKTVFAQVEAIYQLATVAATRVSATKFWKVTLPDGSTATFRGFLLKHDLPMESEDAIVVESEIQVIGKIVFTAAAAAV